MVTPAVDPSSETAAVRGPERADCGGTSGATPESASGATDCGRRANPKPQRFSNSALPGVAMPGSMMPGCIGYDLEATDNGAKVLE